MADDRLLPNSLRDARSRALNEILDRLDALDLTPILMRRIASVPEAALVFLAEDYQVQGYAGFELTTDVEARRELLRNALELHRNAGTSGAVRAALAKAGYTAEVDETSGLRYYNGRFKHNGEIRYNAVWHHLWALFRVVLEDTFQEAWLDATRLSEIRGIIDVWQNARSHLEHVAVRRPHDDVTPEPLDTDMPMTMTLWPIADGSYVADGSIDAGGIRTNEVLAA